MEEKGESVNGRVRDGGQPSWLFYFAIGCATVIRRIFKVLLIALVLYPLSRNKQSARFFREVAAGGE